MHCPFIFFCSNNHTGEVVAAFFFQGGISLESKYKYSWPFSSYMDSAITNLPTCSDVPITPKLVLRALIDRCGHAQSRKKTCENQASVLNKDQTW